MKRRTFVNGVISAGLLSSAPSIPALGDANDKAISQNLHSMARTGRHQQRFAKALKPGMTVGVVAPSSNAFEDDDIRFALDIVSSLGFKPKPGRHLFKRYGYLAGTDSQRAADLNAMFVDDEVDAIFVPEADMAPCASCPCSITEHRRESQSVAGLQRYHGTHQRD